MVILCQEVRSPDGASKRLTCSWT